jgi:predicted NAD/FAD-binding protein
MTEIRQIVDLYELCDSKRRVTRETGISRNTVTKYLNRVKHVQEGKKSWILLKNREIVQPARVVTPEVLEKIHHYLETNLDHPKKQRLTANVSTNCSETPGIKSVTTA